MKKPKIGQKITLNSALVHNDTYLYANIVFGGIYEILDFAYSEISNSYIVQIRDMKNIATWIDLIYFD